jgi:tRNA threonylcarbamoyladenosine biosynthesis protein TsaE
VSPPLTLPEPALCQLAEKLAPLLQTGDALLLTGDLGTGKSTFARALIRARCGDPLLEVASPTFTLVQLYEGTPPLYHYDLYRLKDASELDELGLDDAFSEAITLIEWPEILEHHLPPHRISLQFHYGETADTRTILYVAEGRCSGYPLGHLSEAL